MDSLVICEKNDAAKRISNIISKNMAKTTKYGKVPVYTFQKGGDHFHVLGLRGHILELDYPPAYSQWFRVSPSELIWVDPIKKTSKSATGIVKVLKDLAQICDNVIIATDFDREGELIGTESLEVVHAINPDLPVKRAKFSALTDTEVNGAFENLTQMDYNLSKAAHSRQLVDLAWGATLTRFISIASGKVGKDFLSVGRVQSPTLALIVDREKEIKAFVPKPYWTITGMASKDKLDFKISHANDRFWEEAEAKKAHKIVDGASKGTVTSVEVKTKTDKPPVPYNTTSFLKDAARLGISVAQAMRIAEDLYTNGWISYPRTDNTVYPKSLDIKKILQNLSKTDMGDLAKEVLAQDKLVPTRGKKETTDHPPIHPSEEPLTERLERNHMAVYELVVRRFLATLAPNAQTQTTKVKLDVKGEKFNGTGQKLVVAGWRKYFHYYNPKDIELPELAQSDEVDVKDVDLTRKETEPPRRLGQGALIQKMDELGLGTKSTRHEIIQKLYNRGYLESSPPKPTLSGTAVTEALEEFAQTITEPEMTSTLEKDMDLIADGKQELEVLVKESQQMLEGIYKALDKNKAQIGGRIKEALREQNRLGKCETCGKEMVIRRSRKGKRFAGCGGFPRCRNTHPLPQRGVIKSLMEECAECKAPTIEITMRGKTTQMCIRMGCPLGGTGGKAKKED